MYPDIIVDLHDTSNLRVTFPYDETLVKLIRSVPGRYWCVEQKYWTIPSFSLRNLQSSAARLGVGIVLRSGSARLSPLGWSRGRNSWWPSRGEKTP